MNTKSEIQPTTVQVVFKGIFTVKPETLTRCFQKILANLDAAEITPEIRQVAKHLTEYREAAENYSVE